MKKYIFSGVLAVSLVLSACSNGLNTSIVEDAVVSESTAQQNERGFSSENDDLDVTESANVTKTDTINTSAIENGNLIQEEVTNQNGGNDTMNRNEQNLLGGIKPEDALAYMKTTPNLVIVQVNTAEWKITPGFTDALWIPHDEMAERFDEIPSGVPVMLHCGGGIVSVPAYETLIEKRPDIPELSYIAGSPHSIIDEYNNWLLTNESK